MVHITSFCCCMGLEVGTKLIGSLHLAASVALTIVCALYVHSAGAQMGTVDDADGLYTSVHAISIGVTVLSLVHFCLAITLLYSTFKRRAAGVRVWVGAMGALGGAALVFVAVTAATHGLRGSGSDIFLSFLEGVLFFGTLIYCIVCVHSYYLVLKSCEDMEGPKTDY